MDGFFNVINFEGFSNRYISELYMYVNFLECVDGCGGFWFLWCSIIINRCVVLMVIEVGGIVDIN